MAAELLPDGFQESRLRAVLGRRAGRRPAFIIDSADQRRQLIGEMGGLFDGQPVAQMLQHGAQRGIGLVLVGDAAFAHQLLQPLLGLLDGAVEYGRLHGTLSLVSSGRRPARPARRGRPPAGPVSGPAWSG
jgi:hypothetical protein